MKELKSTMGPRHAFRRAQSMTNHSQKPAYVIYDHVERGYAAQTESAKEPYEKLIKVVHPSRKKN